MRHLRTFRGSVSRDSIIEEDLKEFCKEHLAYLIDDKLRVIVRKLNYKSINNFYEISLAFKEDVNWIDIKYDFIPFFILFSEKYKVIKKSLWYKIPNIHVQSFNYKLFKSVDIEEDKIPDDFNHRMIKLEIEFKREFK